MSFPNTRHTLIQRLATGGESADWHDFMTDYWGPICRFAQWRGNLSHEDAEDVAAEVFEALHKNRLLERWNEVRFARLRTLICTVVRNIVSNRARVGVGRSRLVREHGGMLDRYVEPTDSEAGDPAADQLDAFYAGWVNELLASAVEELLDEYNRNGKGDYFRVLYGRICEGLTMREIADALEIKVSSAENYFRHARQRLGDRLREMTLAHIERYSDPAQIEAEFAEEWNRLGDYLMRNGGTEAVVRQTLSAQESGSRAFRYRDRPSRPDLAPGGAEEAP